MSVSVVGFDLGSLTSYVVVARQGGVESVANEYSDRNTPTCVSFNEKMRFIGHEAKQQQVSNVKNTLCGFNRFIGKNINDEMVINESKRQLCKIVAAEEQRVGFEVNYLGESTVFSAEQVYAMQLTKLKEVAEMNLKTKVIDVVINVPTNATDSERRAILDASKIANLNCIRIINDTTSCALAYGFYRQDLSEDKPKIIAFVDMGYSNLQSSLVSFTKGKMRVMASSCDNIGGRDFDQAIYDHVKAEFKDRYKLVVEDDKKPGVRLMQECEKLKKLMSANSTAIPMSIECFMNDVDVTTKMQRSEFEGLAAPILARVRVTLERLLIEGGVTLDQIEAVEMVGGSTRVAVVKDIIGEVFRAELRTSLNSDEAVAKGCAIQCAILSPALRAKEFTITDAYPYPIVLSYDDEVAEVFPKWNSFPASKQMTFNRGASFKLEARYGACAELPTSNVSMGVFNVTNVIAGPNGEAAKVKVKLRINANGIFTCCQAQQVESVEKQVEVEVDADTNGPSNGEITDNTGEKMATDDVAVENDKLKNEKPANEKTAKVKKMVTKMVSRNVDLPMQAMITQYMPTKINEFNERENQMIQQVKLEKEKAHAKNSVEEYVYEMRDKLYGELEAFVSEADRDVFSSELTAAENWLYEDGEDVSRQLYVDRLAALRTVGDMIVRRAREALDRPMALDEFGKVCVHVQKVLLAIEAKDEQYAHLDENERQTLVALMEEKQAWFTREVVVKQGARASYEDPLVTAAQIWAQKQAIEAVAGPIMGKARPVVVPPPCQETNENTSPNGAATDNGPVADGESSQPTKTEDMDLD